MSIVVVIVGVLAVLAVVGYRKLIVSSHIAEATGMVNGIKLAQEAYHAETGAYADVSTSLVANNTTANAYPIGAGTSSYKWSWGGACGASCTAVDWTMLPVHVSGPVMYGYTTKAGAAGAAPPAAPAITINGAAITWPATPATDWFIASAVGAPNTAPGDTATAHSTVVGSSFTNDLWIDNEGQ